MTEVMRGPALYHKVRTSPDLSVWTVQGDLVLQEYSEGQGEVLGNAKFRLDWGYIAEDGLTPSTVGELNLTGLYVQILKEDGAGAITIGSDTFSDVWQGKMLAPTAATAGTSGMTEYTAAGIATVLNERTCWMGRAIVKASPATFSVAFQLAPFNAWPSGDRSAATGTVGGENVYLHDATQTATGNQWTAAQILKYLFACNFKWETPPSPSGSGQAGLNWAISDPQGCLDYIPSRYDARGKTLLQALNDLAGHNRGLSWYAAVTAASTVTVTIVSGLATSITVGTNTIPANPLVWDLDVTDDPWVMPLVVQQVGDEVADEIVIQGSPRTVGITLGVWGSGSPFAAHADAQLVSGWTSAAETACNTYLDGGGSVTGRRASYEHAWRRFPLRPEGWSGGQYGSGGMPDGLVTATDASYGVVGYTGEVTRLGLSTLAGLWYAADGNLPCAPGFTALNVGSRQPMVIVAEDDTAGTWIDHSGGWTAWVEESPPAVILDDGADGAIIRDILQAGRKILVTIALRDFWPFQVSWRRDPAEWPTADPRVRTIIVPDQSQEYLLDDMVTGVASDAGGALTATASQVTTRDNLPQLRALLAQARAWYTEPYQRVTFTDRGVWDSDPSYRPGTILGTVNDGTEIRDCEVMVTRRTVRLEYATGDDGIQVPYWSTTWETDVVYPDVEAVL